MVARVIQIARLLIILASRHRNLVFENLALRQQLAVYHRTRPKPTVRWPDRVSERTISRLMPRRRTPPSQTWRTFLSNHLASTVAIDFFAVPTLTCRISFVFVVLAHDRRRILHVNVTQHPTSAWTRQQLRHLPQQDERAVSPPRPRHDLRHSVRACGRGIRSHDPHRTPLALAESLRRTRDRLDPPRVSGPPHRHQ
jgi:hypothetical protein